MTDTKKVWEEIYAVIQEEENLKRKLPNEKTAQEVMEELELDSKNITYRYLDKLVKKGLLKRRKVLLGKHWTNVYSPTVDNNLP